MEVEFMNIAYVRVSTIEQHEDRQLEELKKYNIDKWFIEKVSAKDTNRPELINMMEFVNNFYQFNKHLTEQQQLTVYVKDFSRLARSTMDLLKLIEELGSKGVKLISVKESFDTSTPTGKLMLTMMAAINEFERTNMLERQREGIAIAKQKGVYKGRKKIDFPKYWEQVYKQWKNREITGAAAMKELKLKRNTFYNLVKEYEGKQ